MEGLTEGRIVHYVLPAGDHRPAIVTKNYGREDGSCNLIVFLDGNNDLVGLRFIEGTNGFVGGPFLVWLPSVLYSEAKEPGTWHWIERA